MAVLPDGKVLAAGNISAGTGLDFALNRYNADGTSDTTFGTNGKKAIDVGSGDSLYGALVQPDGKIVLTGTSAYTNGSTYTLVRLNADGTFDTTFSGDGKATPAVTSGTLSLNGALAVQADGKILLGGHISTTTGAYDMTLLRFTADGNLDTSFNGTGSVTLRSDNGFPRSINLVSVQKDGKILALGNAQSDSQADHIMIMRFLPDGSLDQTFGTKGMTDTAIPHATANSYAGAANLLVQPDGKILLVGADGSTGGDFILVRYNADGSLDGTFSLPANTLDGNSVFAEPPWYLSPTPAVLDADVQILDAELAAANSYGGATLTLHRHEGANADDGFGAKSGGTLSALTAGSYFSVDNVTIGRVTANSAGTLTLTFASNATQAQVDRTMQQIGYLNKSDAPPEKVQIDWTFSDGNTGAQGTGGALKATGSTTVTIVGRNDDPVSSHAIPDQKIATGVGFSYVIPADSFTDPDHDALSYSIAMSDGSGLPPWLSFDATTRTLSGKPDALDAGFLLIRVTVKDPAGASTATTFALNIETSSNHVDGTAGADNLAGSSGDDVLQGFAGNDVLDGKGGADLMAGGDGNDVYYVDNAGDVVNEAVNAGTDTVFSTAGQYLLAPNVENARVLSDGQGNLTGNELGNILFAGKGDNVLDGGAGSDTASYAYATTGVTVSLATTGPQDTEGSGTDTLLNIEHLSGSNFDDNLLGNQADNTLYGGAGADFMAGANGSDTYIVDDVGDIVRETNADPTKGGIDTVLSSISYALGANVENLTLTGGSPINGGGNALANSLVGNSADNILNGSLGADTMAGGLGNDTYYVDNAGDVVVEQANAGIDTVISTVTRALGANQENLTLAGTTAINGTGNGLANTIVGNNAANVIDGGAGADKMMGGLGNDVYYVDDAGDQVVESGDPTAGGIDTVAAWVSYTLGDYVENLNLGGTAAINATGNTLANRIVGNSAANVLTGGAGADSLFGALGNDTLVGGDGKDVLEGGGGSDVFVFNAAAESGTTSATWDVINDFVRGQDKIDLRGIDANTATTANDAFTAFIAGTAAFTAAGQLKFVGGVLYGNTDADADAEFAIQVTGVIQLTTADVVL
jgi:uncharacterized delta-60 repeat protein